MSLKIIALVIVSLLASCATSEKCPPQNKSDYCEGLRRANPPKPPAYLSPFDSRGVPIDMNPHASPDTP